MKRKKIFPMSLSELEALSTKQLLAELRRLHQCEESFALSDRDVHDEESSGSIEFKDSLEWIAEYNHLKGILAQREHIVKGSELVEMRHGNAGKGKRSDRKMGKRRLG